MISSCLKTILSWVVEVKVGEVTWGCPYAPGCALEEDMGTVIRGIDAAEVMDRSNCLAVANLERIVRVGGLFCRADMVHVYFQPLNFTFKERTRRRKKRKIYFFRAQNQGFLPPLKIPKFNS